MIKSKKIKKKNLRKRSSSVLEEEEENIEETSNLIQEAMEIRKFRKRPEGMETKELSIGEENKKQVGEEVEATEPISKAFSDNSAITSSFKTQTNYMDTEKLMNKYIEDEIRKKRGENIENEEEEEIQQSTATDEFNSKYEIPENLKVREKYIKEDNVTTSLSMLTSIQEVDLGIENKLKNIEATEKAREKLEKDKKKKKDMVNNLIGVTVAAERFYNAKSNDKRFDRMFSEKDKEQKNKETDDKSQREVSKNPLIAKINKMNSHNSGSSNNKSGNGNNNYRSNHNGNGGRNYDRRNMATDDITYERFKKRFRM
ncbi:hypothetical protein BCR36DRAFT_414411 [Piromyces finnis]|uniref:Hepatocellular carcinoma-associated antigen 59 domain-containing protein n=1 Tax=Piromyces finnis TaxID=1754191 RepID=A0A1Y1V3J5_9FUNG|nr:hypothetical protein BCR36DRAFT_414411 [Piromyces finnis]|eukprot:ORX45817.1 hypothetical protein BCR36DRAFT_414411 [Piromyces finnis]